MSLAQKLVDSWWNRDAEAAAQESKQAASAFQQERPDGGWQHKGGKRVSEITATWLY